METSYTYARDHLAELWDKAISDCEPVIVKRRGHPDLALISADELSSLMETLYLLRSPENARRLKEAYADAQAGRTEPGDIERLRDDVMSHRG
ncbi:MAG: type II toxin-antitoxin system Phd/YefM family antitoxin [Tepidiformaceae bacterium]